MLTKKTTASLLKIMALCLCLQSLIGCNLGINSQPSPTLPTHTTVKVHSGHFNIR